MRKRKYKKEKFHKNKKEAYVDGLRQYLLDANIPVEAISKESLITIIGYSEIWIENYQSLIEYKDDCINIQVASYIIQIEGQNLMISHYMEEHMMIRGTIRRITYM